MGKLKVADMPWTQPAFAPLYPAESFPVITRQRWQVMVVYETDPEFVETVLPEGVELSSDPPLAAVWSATHAHSTMGGPYRESGAGVTVTYEGETYFYPLVVYLGEGTEEWFAAGREVWGHQKKLGKTEIFEPDGSGLITSVFQRPAGVRLMELQVGPLEREASAEEIGFLPVLTLRTIPRADGPELQIAELIVTEADLEPKKGSDGRLEFWAGPAEVNFPSKSDRDPLYRLPVEKVVAGYYGCFENITTPFGKVLKQLIP